MPSRFAGSTRRRHGRIRVAMGVAPMVIALVLALSIEAQAQPTSITVRPTDPQVLVGETLQFVAFSNQEFNLARVGVLAMGRSHGCVLLTTETVVCWGANNFGQLGNGTVIPSTAPVAVSGLTGVTAIAAGFTHTCALVYGGAVKCWGQNVFGNLGDGTTTQSNFPVNVVGLSGVTAIAGGGNF